MRPKRSRRPRLREGPHGLTSVRRRDATQAASFNVLSRLGCFDPGCAGPPTLFHRLRAAPEWARPFRSPSNAKQPSLSSSKSTCVSSLRVFQRGREGRGDRRCPQQGCYSARIVRTLDDGGFSHVAGGRNYMAGLAAHSEDDEISVVVRGFERKATRVNDISSGPICRRMQNPLQSLRKSECGKAIATKLRASSAGCVRRPITSHADELQHSCARST